MSVGLIGIVALMLVLFTSIISVIVLGNITALVAMLIMNFAAAVLARGCPGVGFRIPGGPVLPVIAVLACLTQFVSYDPTDLLAAATSMGLGLALYYQRGRGRHMFPDDALDSIREAIYQRETPLAPRAAPPLPPSSTRAPAGALPSDRGQLPPPRRFAARSPT